MKTAIGLAINGVTFLIVMVVAWALVKKLLNSSISCPECFGGSRRPPGPCPTCGPNDRVHRGNNPTPRSLGVRKNAGGPISMSAGRTHGKGWWRDRGSKGLIS